MRINLHTAAAGPKFGAFAAGEYEVGPEAGQVPAEFAAQLIKAGAAEEVKDKGKDGKAK